MNQNNYLDVDWSSIPEPVDDGSADHLKGTIMPSMKLPSTIGGMVDLGDLWRWTILYFYPMMERPGMPMPEGWDAIPGAKGCTPQACAFSNLSRIIRGSGASCIYGISTQETSDQLEAATRLSLNFPLLSDSRLELTKALSLPTMEVEGKTLIRRLTLVLSSNRIVKVFFPVFPPDGNALDVLNYLRSHGL